MERSAWSLYRLCSISSSERDIDTALAYIQRAGDEHPANGIATCGYATSYLTAINLVFKKGYQAGVDIGENDLEQFGARMGIYNLTVVVEAVNSLKEVARALKAADCNVVRANQFINYANPGEGENPVADIMPEVAC